MRDEELIHFAAEFREGILDGHPSFCMCFAVCAPLVLLLGMYGVECSMEKSDLENGPYAVANHFWIQLEDGRVLDPTADQFLDEARDSEWPPPLLPPVYLGPPLAFHVTLTPTRPSASGRDEGERA